MSSLYDSDAVVPLVRCSFVWFSFLCSRCASTARRRTLAKHDADSGRAALVAAVPLAARTAVAAAALARRRAEVRRQSPPCRRLVAERRLTTASGDVVELRRSFWLQFVPPLLGGRLIACLARLARIDVVWQARIDSGASARSKAHVICVLADWRAAVADAQRRHGARAVANRRATPRRVDRRARPRARAAARDRLADAALAAALVVRRAARRRHCLLALRRRCRARPRRRRQERQRAAVVVGVDRRRSAHRRERFAHLRRLRGDCHAAPTQHSARRRRALCSRRSRRRRPALALSFATAPGRQRSCRSTTLFRTSR